MSGVPVVLVVAVIVLAAVTAALAWLAVLVARASIELEDEVAALAQMRVARELLATDLARTRRRLGAPSAEIWPPGPDR